jgi:hypothetical protein
LFNTREDIKGGTEGIKDMEHAEAKSKRVDINPTI